MTSSGWFLREQAAPTLIHSGFEPDLTSLRDKEGRRLRQTLRRRIVLVKGVEELAESARELPATQYQRRHRVVEQAGDLLVGHRPYAVGITLDELVDP